MPVVIGCGVNSVNSSHLWIGRQEKTGKEKPRQIGPVKTRYDTAKNKLKPIRTGPTAGHPSTYELDHPLSNRTAPAQVSPPATPFPKRTFRLALRPSCPDLARHDCKLGNRPGRRPC